MRGAVLHGWHDKMSLCLMTVKTFVSERFEIILQSNGFKRLRRSRAIRETFLQKLTVRPVKTSLGVVTIELQISRTARLEVFFSNFTLSPSHYALQTDNIPRPYLVSTVIENARLPESYHFLFFSWKIMIFKDTIPFRHFRSQLYLTSSNRNPPQIFNNIVVLITSNFVRLTRLGIIGFWQYDVITEQWLNRVTNEMTRLFLNVNRFIDRQNKLCRPTPRKVRRNA